MKRVMFFIDGDNWRIGASKCYGIKSPKIQNFIQNIYKKEYVLRKAEVVRSYYYCAKITKEKSEDAHIAQQKWFSYAKYLENFEIRTGRYKKNKDGSWQEKGVDVYLATDLIRMAFQGLYDYGVVISGDTDLVPAIQAAKDAGKNIHVFSYDKSSHLQEKADYYEKISKDYFNVS